MKRDTIFAEVHGQTFKCPECGSPMWDSGEQWVACYRQGCRLATRLFSRPVQELKPFSEDGLPPRDGCKSNLDWLRSCLKKG